MPFNLSFVMAFTTLFAPTNPFILLAESSLAIIVGAVTIIVISAVSKLAVFRFSFKVYSII
ncbi:hypothetical protein D3C85_1685680 [compost metagenome]